MRGAWQAALIALAVGFAFWPALRGGWIWDDSIEISQNPVMRDPGGLAEIWGGRAGADYFPLTATAEWAGWRLRGARPGADHALSLALHLLSALLFWRLLAALGAPLAWAGGLLFGIHPLTVESVAWVSELKNTLSLPLLLLALLAYLRFDAARRPAAYAAALACFLLALLAKSSVVMLPAVILLHAWWRRGRVAAADLRAAAPFFGLAAALGGLTVWFQHHRAIAEGHAWAGGWPERLAFAGRAVVFYLDKTLWPAGLVPVYPLWPWPQAAGLAALSWAVAVALTLWFWRRRRGWGRHALLGWGFFVLNLIPVLGLVGMAYLRISRVADHFAYISLLGPAGLAAAGLGRAWDSLGRRGPRIVLGMAAAGAALALAGETRAYARVFRSDLSLWSYTLARNPAAWIAEGNLGYTLFLRDDPAAALPHLRRALELRPGYAEAHYNLGTVLLRLGRPQEAIAEYERAIALQPASAGMENNLGSALAQNGRLAEAAAHFARAVALDPDNVEAHHNLGNALLLAGHPAEAAAQYREALRLDPGDEAARTVLRLAEQAQSAQNR